MRPATCRSVALFFILALTTACLFPGCAAAGGSNAPDVVESQGNRERALMVLQTRFRDSHPDIRANTLEALEPLRDKRVTSLQEEGLRDPVWVVRFAAAMGAGKQRNKDLKPILFQKIQTETDPSVQVAMVYALRRMGDDTYMNLLPRRVQSSDPVVRANVALVLGLLGEPSAVIVLRPLKRDPDERVKLEVTAALARLGDREAQNAILAMSVNRFAEDYYTAIATAADLNNPEVNNVLLRGLKMKDQIKDPSPEDRLILIRASLIAARSLGKRGDNQGAQLALECAENPKEDPQLRALGALALGEILNSRGEYHLKPLLSDPNPHVQIAAAAAILNIASRVQALATQPSL